MNIESLMTSLTPDSLNSLPRREREELLRLLEERRARNAKASLLEYCKYITIPGAPVVEDSDEFYPDNVEPALHHILLLEALHRVADGEIKNLMVFMPPGSAKSTYASVVFPTWFMGRAPQSNIIMTTYGSDLAKKFGRKCRSIAKSDEYGKIFGCALTGDNSAADDWSLTNGSTYMCGGILSGITGNRADGLIIDDPVKGRQEADSETIRSNIRDAYRDDLCTRLKPNGWRIIIQTRWHEDDLSGSILPEDYSGQTGWITARTGENWYVLSLQAECEREDDPLQRQKGEFLWTDWFPVEKWQQIKRENSFPTARSWNALYQQRPAPDEGAFFLRQWIRWYDSPPKHLKTYGSSDYAVTEGDGDYTVHLVAGVDVDDNIYLLDLWRGRTDSFGWVEELISLISQYSPLEWGEESGQIIKSVGPLIDKRQRETGTYCYRKQFSSASDKPTRAQAIRGRMAMGKVYFPKDKPWVNDFINELMTFPAGRNDDQVDAFSLLGRMLAEMHSAEEPKKEPSLMESLNQPMTYQEAFKQHIARRSRDSNNRI